MPTVTCKFVVTYQVILKTRSVGPFTLPDLSEYKTMPVYSRTAPSAIGMARSLASVFERVRPEDILIHSCILISTNPPAEFVDQSALRG